ncbi:hypothetical protein IAU59_002469 [Kwoniella sp. CBS 9459]
MSFDTERGSMQQKGSGISVSTTLEISVAWGNGVVEVVRVDPPPGYDIVDFCSAYPIPHIAHHQATPWMISRLEQAQLACGWSGIADLASLSVVGWMSAAFGWIVQELPRRAVSRQYQVAHRDILPHGRVAHDDSTRVRAHNVLVDGVSHLSAAIILLRILSLVLPADAPLDTIRDHLRSKRAPPTDLSDRLTRLYPRSWPEMPPYTPGKATHDQHSRPELVGESLIFTGFSHGLASMDLLISVIARLGRGRPTIVLFNLYRLQLWFGHDTVTREVFESLEILGTNLFGNGSIFIGPANQGPRNMYVCESGQLNPTKSTLESELKYSRQHASSTSSTHAQLTNARHHLRFRTHPDDRRRFAPTSPETLLLPWLGAPTAPKWTPLAHPPSNERARELVFTTRLDQRTIYLSHSYEWRPSHVALLTAFLNGTSIGSIPPASSVVTQIPPPRPASAPGPLSMPSLPLPDDRTLMDYRTFSLPHPNNKQQVRPGRPRPVMTRALPPPLTGTAGSDMFPIYRLVPNPEGIPWAEYVRLYGRSWHLHNCERYKKLRTKYAWEHIMNDPSLLDEAVTTASLHPEVIKSTKKLDWNAEVPSVLQVLIQQRDRLSATLSNTKTPPPPPPASSSSSSPSPSSSEPLVQVQDSWRLECEAGPSVPKPAHTFDDFDFFDIDSVDAEQSEPESDAVEYEENAYEGESSGKGKGRAI